MGIDEQLSRSLLSRYIVGIPPTLFPYVYGLYENDTYRNLGAKESETQRGKMTCSVSLSTWRRIKDFSSLGPNLTFQGMTPEDRQAVVTEQLPALSLRVRWCRVIPSHTCTHADSTAQVNKS